MASALINQQLISKLVLHHENGSGNTSIDAPMAVYQGGTNAPDLKLYDLESLSDWRRQTIGAKNNVVTVNQPTLLSELIKTNEKIKGAIKLLPKNGKLKLYWSACASQVPGNNANL